MSTTLISQVRFISSQEGFPAEIDSQVPPLIAEVLKDPPFSMNWAVQGGNTWSSSTQNLWRFLCEKVRSTGQGGSILLVTKDDSPPAVVGFANCVPVDEEVLDKAQLLRSELSEHGQVGDWWLSFAGLHSQFRGGRYEPETSEFIARPEEGWSNGSRPGKGLYSSLFGGRIKNWCHGGRIWLRTHPECIGVCRMANKFGFRIAGRYEISQGGNGLTPKVVFVREAD